MANPSGYGSTTVSDESFLLERVGFGLGTVVDAVEATTEYGCANHRVEEPFVKILGAMGLED